MLGIPVIDMGSTDAIETGNLNDACCEWGFFQIINHGIPTDARRELYLAMERFFTLPATTKQSVARTQQNPWGYYDAELTKNVRDWKEIFDVGRPQPGHASSPQWPAGEDQFEEAVMAWFGHCELLSQRLLQRIGTCLGATRHDLEAAFAPNHSSFLRLNYYPPCDDPAPADSGDSDIEGHLGIHRHTDAGALTVLVQDDVASLQVRRDGTWYTVKPLADALIINIGDLFQVWSNDRYQAPEHRVLANKTQARFSAPFFYNPDFDANIAPLTDDTPRYRSVAWNEFRNARALGDYGDYGREIQITDYRL